MQTEEIIIKPGLSKKNYWKDLWRYRELFYILSWRDIKVRYKQTFIGAAWSIVRPLFTMLVFTFVFGHIAKLPSNTTAPYAIMVYAALLPWQFFSTALVESSNSLIGNSGLISKVYFPRLIIPASSMITSVVDFLISLGLMMVLFVYFDYYPSWQIIFLPLCLLGALVASLGLGLYITALNVKYRDFRFVIPFIVQLGLYISPVGFNSGIIADKHLFFYYLNPMASVIDGFRWCLLGGDQVIYVEGIWISSTVAIVMLVIGIYQFRKMEKTFADII